MKFIYSFIFISIFTCCINDGSLTSEQVEKFKKNVIENGDQYSYTRLLIHYYATKHDYELLPYSIIMADKKNNVTANKQIFIAVLKINNNGVLDYNSLKFLSNNSKRFAISHLIMAAKLGDSDCKKILEVDYSKYKINENTLVTDSLLDNLN